MAKKPKKKPVMPAVPRDAQQATFSELVPFKSSKIVIWKSPIFLIAVMGAVVAGFLFNYMQVIQSNSDMQSSVAQLAVFATVAIVCMTVPALALVYVYMRPGKPFWYYLIPVVVVGIFTAVPQIFIILSFPFRGILPTMQWAFAPDNIFLNFIGMFFAAGLTEEYIKVIPLLVFAWMSFRVVDGKAKAQPDSIWPCRGPVDGVLLAMAGGAGFIIAETGMQYVPNEVVRLTQATGSFEFGMSGGLMLLFGRVLGVLGSHIGYSAIFGYAIGLAVIRPGMRWKIMLIGFVAASAIHAVWNSFAKVIPFGFYLVAILMAVITASVVLKARQLAAVAAPESLDTSGSIVVPKDAQRPAAQPAAGAARPAPAPAPSAPTPRPAPAPAPSAAPAVEKPVMLQVDGVSFPLRAGENLGFADDPRLAEKAAGVEAAVVAHPTKPNVVGLRNAGQTAWTARLRDGSKQVIEHNQNIRLAPTVQVDFGNGLVGTVVEVG